MNGLPFLKTCASDLLVELDVDAAEVRTHLFRGMNRLAYFLLEHQRNNEARCVLEVLVERDPTNILALYNLACAYSLLVNTNQANIDAALAVQTLQRALEAGYRDVNHLLNDPDFNNIRSHPEFVAFTDRLLGKKNNNNNNVEVVKKEQEEIVAKEPEQAKVEEKTHVIVDVDENDDISDWEILNGGAEDAQHAAVPVVQSPIAMNPPVLVPQQVVVQEEEKNNKKYAQYEAELKILNEMGFVDTDANHALLVAEKGDLSNVISFLLQQ